MKEGPFLGWILDVAARFGWKVYHVPAPMRVVAGGRFVGAKEAAGLCDLIMFHTDPPRLILAEVKGTGGELSDEQREFLRLARAVREVIRDAFHGNDARSPAWADAQVPLGVYTWRPGLEDLIEATLRGKVMIDA